MLWRVAAETKDIQRLTNGALRFQNGSNWEVTKK